MAAQKMADMIPALLKTDTTAMQNWCILHGEGSVGCSVCRCRPSRVHELALSVFKMMTNLRAVLAMSPRLIGSLCRKAAR
eukprot:9460766-Alexandrium_andersonii.AAC.1